jgi:hypothetical protein
LATTISERSDALDWGAAWRKWVDREVDFVTDWHHGERAKAYFERRP